MNPRSYDDYKVLSDKLFEQIDQGTGDAASLLPVLAENLSYLVKSTQFTEQDKFAYLGALIGSGKHLKESPNPELLQTIITYLDKATPFYWAAILDYLFVAGNTYSSNPLFKAILDIKSLDLDYISKAISPTFKLFLELTRLHKTNDIEGFKETCAVSFPNVVQDVRGKHLFESLRAYCEEFLGKDALENHQDYRPWLFAFFLITSVSILMYIYYILPQQQKMVTNKPSMRVENERKQFNRPGFSKRKKPVEQASSSTVPQAKSEDVKEKIEQDINVLKEYIDRYEALNKDFKVIGDNEAHIEDAYKHNCAVKEKAESLLLQINAKINLILQKLKSFPELHESNEFSEDARSKIKNFSDKLDELIKKNKNTFNAEEAKFKAWEKELKVSQKQAEEKQKEENSIRERLKANLPHIFLGIKNKSTKEIAEKILPKYISADDENIDREEVVAYLQVITQDFLERQGSLSKITILNLYLEQHLLIQRKYPSDEQIMDWVGSAILEKLSAFPLFLPQVRGKASENSTAIIKETSVDTSRPTAPLPPHQINVLTENRWNKIIYRLNMLNDYVNDFEQLINTLPRTEEGSIKLYALRLFFICNIIRIYESCMEITRSQESTNNIITNNFVFSSFADFRHALAHGNILTNALEFDEVLSKAFKKLNSVNVFQETPQHKIDFKEEVAVVTPLVAHNITLENTREDFEIHKNHLDVFYKLQSENNDSPVWKMALYMTIATTFEKHEALKSKFSFPDSKHSSQLALFRNALYHDPEDQQIEELFPRAFKAAKSLVNELLQYFSAPHEPERPKMVDRKGM